MSYSSLDTQYASFPLHQSSITIALLRRTVGSILRYPVVSYFKHTNRSPGDRKSEMHRSVEISTDTHLFTLHERSIAMIGVILPKCMSTNHCMHRSSSFLQINATPPLRHDALFERVVQNARANTIMSKEKLSI